MEAEDGTPAEAAVIDVDAEEEEAGQLRAVLRCPTTSTADVAPAEQVSCGASLPRHPLLQ